MPRCSLIAIGRGVISTCCRIRGGSVLGSTPPPQSGQGPSRYSHTVSISSGEKSDRSWRVCPRCAPCFRSPFAWDAAFGGLTIALEGGLDELDESFFDRASSASRAFTRSVNVRTNSSSSSHRGHWPDLGSFMVAPSYRSLLRKPRAISIPVNGYGDDLPGGACEADGLRSVAEEGSCDRQWGGGRRGAIRGWRAAG